MDLMNKSDILERLEVLQKHGYQTNHNENMTVEELTDIFETTVEKIRKETDDANERAKLFMLIFDLSVRKLITYNEGGRLMKSGLSNFELIEEIRKLAPGQI